MSDDAKRGDSNQAAPNLNLPNLRDGTKPWLYQPKEKQLLGDVAKVAVTMRAGLVPGPFLDEGFPETVLGTVGRCLLVGPGDLGLPASQRRFVLARGTTRLCLAEVVDGDAGEEPARMHLDAVERQRERAEGKAVVGWLIAASVDERARTILREADALATSTRA
jgi:hypothetical protein